MKSIRSRLLAGLLALFSLIWMIMALATYYESQHEVAELFDAQLAQAAGVLAQLGSLDGTNGPVTLERQVYGHRYEKKIAFQIGAGSELVLRSANAPTAPMSREEGFSDQLIGGEHWRIFRYETAPGLWVITGERYEVREELIGDVTRGALYPITLALPVLALLIWFGVGKGLSPLRRFAGALSRQSPARLRPVEPGTDLPAELVPVGEALNDLLRRLEEAFDRERRFNAVAAHELRTPLASIRTQAQVAMRAGDSAETKHALDQIIRVVDRTTRMVEQLLTLARLEPDTRPELFAPVRLRAVAAEVLSELGPQAFSRDIELSLHESGPPAEISGNATALAVMLKNLVENSIRYTPQGGSVQVMVDASGQSPVVTVSDTGPGISEQERERIFERFYRGLASRETSGFGLGLSIVKRIAEIHGAQLDISGAESGGAHMRIVFPVGNLARKRP